LALWYNATVSYVLSSPLLPAHSDVLCPTPLHSSMSNPGRTMSLVLITSLMDRHLVTLDPCPPTALSARSVSVLHSILLCAVVDDSVIACSRRSRPVSKCKGPDFPHRIPCLCVSKGILNGLAYTKGSCHGSRGYCHGQCAPSSL
jgi:hypothetical protein